MFHLKFFNFSIMKFHLVILGLFLSFSVYSQADKDILDFKNGNILKYECDGSGAANGLKFSMNYPNSYKILPPNRPHIINSLTSATGVNVAFEVTQSNIGYDTMIQLLSDAETFKEIALEKGSHLKLIDIKTNLIIDGEFATCGIYKTNRKTINGKVLYLHMQVYTIVYGQYIITINLGVNGTSTYNAKILFDSYLPLFNSMMSSFVIVSKWKKNDAIKPIVTPSPPLEVNENQYIFGLLPRSYLRTFMKYLVWLVIGIPILYSFFKKPKPKKEKAIHINDVKQKELFVEKSIKSAPIKWNYKTLWKEKEYTLTQQQKIIYSITVLIIGFILSAALAGNVFNKENDSNYYSDTWYIWIAFCLIELYIQNKIWSEIFRFKYLTVIKKKTNEA